MSSAAQFDLYSEAVRIPHPVYQEVLTPLSPPKSIKPSNIMGCTPINDGNQLKVRFADNNTYTLHSKWMKDSSPTNVGADFYRKSAQDVFMLDNFKISSAELQEDGTKLAVTFDTLEGSPGTVLTYDADWLHSFAPFVGKHEGGLPAPTIEDTSSCFEPLIEARKGWTNESIEVPTFDARELMSSYELQREFLEKMVCPGVATITNLGAPPGLTDELCGVPLEELSRKIIGKMNQHPVRATRYFVMRKTQESAQQGGDYNMSNPLSMHTDHTVYHGTPGFLQMMYQAEGAVFSKVCDGFALAEYVRENHPAEFELLTTVKITHSSRNVLYTKEGGPRRFMDGTAAEGDPFELVHSHPVIQLDSKGRLEKVVQSETKRGICAVPFDKYDDFMAAYELWCRLCEDPKFVHHFPWPEHSAIITNNHRTLHGRATIPPGVKRTMCGGYFAKTIVENRYRLMKQKSIEAKKGTQWVTRVPNQVLTRMV